MTASNNHSVQEQRESGSANPDFDASKPATAAIANAESGNPAHAGEPAAGALVVRQSGNDDDAEDDDINENGDENSDFDNNLVPVRSGRSLRPYDNDAILSCIHAHRRAYDKEIKKADWDDDEPDFEADQAGKAAYVRAIPPLVGYQNICDSLACVAYAQFIHLLHPDEATEFRATAKIALTALRLQPKPPKQPPQRSKKSSGVAAEK
jgi:hypothetical protein